MLILNNFSVLYIWLEERVKREGERDILLRPLEQKHRQARQGEERGEKEGGRQERVEEDEEDGAEHKEECATEHKGEVVSTAL